MSPEVGSGAAIDSPAPQTDLAATMWADGPVGSHNTGFNWTILVVVGATHGDGQTEHATPCVWGYAVSGMQSVGG